MLELESNVLVVPNPRAQRVGLLAMSCMPMTLGSIRACTPGLSSSLSCTEHALLDSLNSRMMSSIYDSMC